MKSLVMIMMIAGLTVACSSPPTQIPAAPKEQSPVPPAVAPQAAATPAVDPEVNAKIVARGYEPIRRDGKILYCRPHRMTGSHFNHKSCLTDVQVAEQDRVADKDKEQMDRMRHMPACIGGNC